MILFAEEKFSQLKQNSGRGCGHHREGKSLRKQGRGFFLLMGV